ncbi:hypothetical protein [Legionella sainthelensi]
MRKALNAFGHPIARRRTQRLMKKAAVFVRYWKLSKIF